MAVHTVKLNPVSIGYTNPIPPGVFTILVTSSSLLDLCFNEVVGWTAGDETIWGAIIVIFAVDFLVEVRRWFPGAIAMIFVGNFGWFWPWLPGRFHRDFWGFSSNFVVVLECLFGQRWNFAIRPAVVRTPPILLSPIWWIRDLLGSQFFFRFGCNGFRWRQKGFWGNWVVENGGLGLSWPWRLDFVVDLGVEQCRNLGEGMMNSEIDFGVFLLCWSRI